MLLFGHLLAPLTAATCRLQPEQLDGDSGSSTNVGLATGLALSGVVILAGLGGVIWAWKTGRLGGAAASGAASSEQYTLAQSGVHLGSAVCFACFVVV